MTQTFRYHPRTKPIPDGWEQVGDMENSHHGFWSVMIREIPHGADEPRAGEKEFSCDE